ncbi:MAG: FMN-binding protein [Thalassotalea sp.]
MKILSKKIYCLAIPFLLLFSTSGVTKGVYQTSEQFINQVFNGESPKAKMLWLKAEDKAVIAEIMSRKYHRMRIRYWQKGDESVWILDEIGKEKPITTGIHIKGRSIVQLKVLTFRESRGDEVRHDFFTRQFKSVTLTPEHNLNQTIDGITGATMSVRALTKVAKLALWLDQKIQP